MTLTDLLSNNLARQQFYHPTDLRKVVDINRSAFQGLTHDASILPIKAFPF